MFLVCYNSSIKLSINNHSEEIHNITPFINKYDWDEIEFPSHKKDWNKFEKIIKQLLLMSYLLPTY